MHKTITVFVNNKSKQFYTGLHVKNAIGARNARLVREHRLVVHDQDGNVVDIDGALYDGERLHLEKSDPATYSKEKSTSPE